jgi:predicted unusual protein kinase regulating ubiquinone biosynthesis (AarF/ABC1/UbiB family)
MNFDGSPDHLSWDGQVKGGPGELNAEAEREREAAMKNFASSHPSTPPPTPAPPEEEPEPYFEDTIDPRRQERIRLAALHAHQRWRSASAKHGGTAGPKRHQPGIDHSELTFKQPPGLLPTEIRKNLQGNVIPQVSPSMMRQLNWSANFFKTFARLWLYGVAAIRWALEIVWDKIKSRDTIERRAIRLREAIERIGGSAVKVGQQMAMRIDLLPYEYTVELTKMLDRMTTFPTKYAIERIEATMKKPLLEVFDAFDPVPIGSASVACVFQAFLKNGERVAVKVRRPGIGETFVADCNALALVLQFLEFFTIIRPGLSRNFVYEFRTMLMEELDFKKEARYTELFNIGVKKRMKHVGAPRIYFDLSSEDVMVSEFVAGIWMRELIVAVEKNDVEALALLRAEGIYPELVAKRLLRTNQFGVFENILFHADPHPSNVVVQKNSELVFIDFGSSGAYTTKERNNWKQLSHYHDQADIGRMVQSALAILEPLPPIDVDEFSKRIEGIFWQDLYAFKSEHTEWWERTSAKIWIRFLNLAREYNIPLTLNTLKMIRSTLLYETIAARLYPDVDAYKEHRVYIKAAGKRARKRVHKAVLKFFFKGPSNENYLQIEQLADMANRTTYLAQRWLDSPPFQFSNLVDKASNAISVFLRAILTFWVTTLGLAFGVVAWHLIHDHRQIGIWRACLEVIGYTPYQFLVGVNIFLDIRKVMFRFFDKDIKERNS